jgi:hypothetical protein
LAMNSLAYLYSVIPPFPISNWHSPKTELRNTTYLQETPIWNKLYNATGGRDRFVDELIKIAKHASSLRPATLWLGSGTTQRDRKACWGAGRRHDLCLAQGAPKLLNRIIIPYYSVGMKCAVRFLNAIANYCPHLPVPRVHGYSIDPGNATLCYYFKDWIEGRTLRHFSQGVTSPARLVRRMSYALGSSCVYLNEVI